jgi:Fe2+ or Zn2+ uptake regulation protein
MSTYAKLVRLLWDSTKELNLQSLTESDRMIYMLLVETSKKGLTKVTYDELNELISEEGLVISRAQFYKSLRALESLELISRWHPSKRDLSN